MALADDPKWNLDASQSRAAIKARAKAMPKASQEVMDIRNGGARNLSPEQRKQFQLADGAGQDTIAKNLAGTAKPTGQVVTGGQTNTNNYIDGLMNARRQQTFAQLDKSRNAALGNLDEERAGVQPRYYDARNQTAAGSQQQARNFSEFMASRGGTRGGANAQAEISRQGTLQGNIGGLNRQEQQTYDVLDRRVTQTNNAYQSDRASAVAGLEASRMEALINQFNSDRQFNLQQSGQQFNQGMATQQFGLQQQGQNFNQNMATQQYGAQQEQRGLDNNFRQESFEYTKAVNDLDNAFRNKQFNLAEASQLFEQNFKNKSLAQSANQFAQSLGVQQQGLNQRGQEFLAEMTYKNEALQLNKDEAAQRKFETDVAHAFKRREFDFMEGQANQTTTKTADEYFAAFDNSPNVVSGNTAGTEAEILALQIPDSEIKRLYSRYGIPME